MQGYGKGFRVRWNWGAGTGEGRVVESLTGRVTRKIAGAEITRNASGGNPAYLIEQEDGSQVLKSHSELEGA